ncbi:glycosyltransferase family 2 protein [Bifidobacterium simiarum]|uniref:glycosyltransferase family 2 protein n=1 Tax=Bifidobacterium simiarum TaxID=2045441 RepID=UPI001BDC3298|nr:glycosyltransferase family 2 protein [Bifidobacterium simiarum]MBT1166687.1 glycosyltransferase family 2 protein [Bifidobacterium simiarum]
MVALISVEDDLRFFPATLSAVLDQTVVPGIIVVADCTDATQSPVHGVIELPASGVLGTDDWVRVNPDAGSSIDVQVVRAKGSSSFGDAIHRALDQVSLPARTRALWLLHDDSRPADARCLENLLEAWRNAPTASVLGCKQRAWSGDALHDVGRYATMRHGVASLVVDGEPDQEQYDSRQDVFMVDLAGAVVSLQTWRELGGITRSMGTFGQSADFCRRVCLSGGRVVVVPRSVMAHRRARFEGLRTRNGHPVGEGLGPANHYAAKVDARERYRITDIPGALWLPLWLWRLLVSVVLFFALLAGKRPYEGACELGAPWRALVWLPSAFGARRRVAKQTKTTLRQLSVLVARRDQISRWRERSEAFSNAKDVPLLSPLAVEHLRVQRRRRLMWALAMALLALAAGLASNFTVLRAAFSGAGLHSATLAPSSASLRQVFESATSLYSYGNGLGAWAPPAPFLLVLLAACALTAGHVAQAIALIVFLAAPLSALSFWALAGIFTRSNPVRVACGLLWCVLGGLMGLYAQGNLPMLMVMVFLPAGMAFVFRAVGMYQTEDVISPRASVQSAALSSLCLAVVCASEPQLVLPLLVVFVAFMILVRSHRLMLLLIPVPGAFMLAPTLMNIVTNPGNGSYRQLFGDVMIPDAQVNGTVAAANLFDVIRRAIGLGSSSGLSGAGFAAVAADPMTWLLEASVAVLLVFAVAALFLPFALRVSRMMWVIVVSGAAVAVIASRVAIAPGSTASVAGTVLPGVAFMMLGLLACTCVVAGRAAHPFSPLVRRSQGDTSVRIEQRQRRHYARRNLIIVARALLVLLLVSCIALWGAVCGVRAQRGEHLDTQQVELPLIAQDFLSASPRHRILALSARSSTSVDYAVMRTARGDLIDASPAINVMRTVEPMSKNEKTLADSSARLLLNNDDEAISALTKLGIGGIYVPYAEDSATSTLVSNILASSGTQSVVSNDSGTYVRLTVADANDQGFDDGVRRTALGNPWRRAWVACMAVVIVLYCIVAFPRFHRYEVGA